MKKELFNDFLASVRQGADIIKGYKKPKRKFILDEPDVKNIRHQFKLSQSQFAKLMGISVDTLKNWEQGRRKPQGPARVLLCVVALHPEVFPDVVGL